MTSSLYHQASFLISAPKMKHLPPDEGIEVAFAGRSNAGKSSAINTLTGQSKLAHISKTPGRTQMINLFELDDERRLVDLPGYGYAKVSRSVKAEWERTLDEYLRTRKCLKGIILLMDIRHPLKEFDATLIHWATESNMPVHILLTKSDKFKRGPAINTLQAVKKELPKHLVSIQLFSSLKHTGIDEAIAVLDEWFGETSDAS